MKKTAKHKFLNSALFSALFVPVAFFILRDTIAVLTGILFNLIGGKKSFLYQINDDIARLIIAGLTVLIMPLFFRGKCNFGFKGGKLRLGILLALPELIVPIWNIFQIKFYNAPLVVGFSAVAAAIIHGIGPGVSEEIFCRGFAVSNLMRIWDDKPNRIIRCTLASGIAFGLLHSFNALATGDIFATLVQVVYTAAIGIMNGAVYLRSRNIWGVILLHTLTDISAFIAVFDDNINVTGMDIIFCIFGSLIFIAVAFYLIRPAKRDEIDALWEDGWSFGDDGGKNHAGAKAAAIVSAVLAVTFIASLGVMAYRAKMGYNIPLLSSEEKALDKNIRYRIGEDGKELTLLLPYSYGEQYDLKNSEPDSFILKESRESNGSYQFIFLNSGTKSKKVKLIFSLKLGNTSASINDYSVTVSFKDDGTVSSVGG